MAIIPQGIKPAAATFAVKIRPEAAEVIASNHHEVTEQQNTALEIVTLAFAVHVAQQEDTQDNRHHIPLWEEETERVSTDLLHRYF